MFNEYFWTITYIITNMAETMVLYYFTYVFLSSKEISSIRKYLPYVLYFAVLSALNIMHVNTYITIAASNILIFLNIFINLKGSFPNKIFVIALYDVFILASETLAMSIVMGLFNIGAGIAIGGDLQKFFGLIVSTIFKVLFQLYIYHIKSKAISKLTVRFWLMFLIMPVISFAMIILVVNEVILKPEDTNIALFMGISLGILVFNFIMINLLKEIVKSAELQQRYEFSQMQMEAQQKEYEMIEKFNRDAHRIRHDMRNHLICLKLCLDNHDDASAIDYINRLEHKIDYSICAVSSGNIYMDALLNYKYNEAQKKRVDIQFDCLLPEHIEIDIMDINVIIANALDNAIEACEKIKDENIKRIIDVKAHVKQGYLYFSIANPITELPLKVGGKLISRKIDRLRHGYGLENIVLAVEKYNGFVRTDIKAQQFVLDIIMPFMRENKK